MSTKSKLPRRLFPFKSIFTTNKSLKATMTSNISQDSQNFKILTEGKVKFITEYSPLNKDGIAETETTFYNPVQVFNRDISLLSTYTFARKMQRENPDNFNGILFYDALSASGSFNQTACIAHCFRNPG